jgi:hypothetical protein
MIWRRTLRTPSSERFLAFENDKEVAAIDLHFLANGTISGTVILLRASGLNEGDIHKLLTSFDGDFLSDFDLKHGVLTYTVVLGDLLGNYEATDDLKHVESERVTTRAEHAQ